MKLYNVLGLAMGLLLMSTAVFAQEVAAPTAVTAAPAASVQPAKAPARGKIMGGAAYAAPTSLDLLQSLVMLDGIDVRDTKIIDQYARWVYCDLYKEKFNNDFEWNQTRSQIMERIKLKKENFRTFYEIGGIVYLGRYDFDTQHFPLANNSALMGVSSLILIEDMNPNNECSTMGNGFALREMLARLRQPFTFDRLKIPMDEAEKLLARLDKMKNAERKMYVRFRIILHSVVPSSKNGLPNTFVADVVSVDVFYDREMTQLYMNVPID